MVSAGYHKNCLIFIVVATGWFDCRGTSRTIHNKRSIAESRLEWLTSFFSDYGNLCSCLPVNSVVTRLIVATLLVLFFIYNRWNVAENECYGHDSGHMLNCTINFYYVSGTILSFDAVCVGSSYCNRGK